MVTNVPSGLPSESTPAQTAESVTEAPSAAQTADLAAINPSEPALPPPGNVEQAAASKDELQKAIDEQGTGALPSFASAPAPVEPVMSVSTTEEQLAAPETAASGIAGSAEGKETVSATTSELLGQIHTEPVAAVNSIDDVAPSTFAADLVKSEPARAEPQSTTSSSPVAGGSKPNVATKLTKGKASGPGRKKGAAKVKEFAKLDDLVTVKIKGYPAWPGKLQVVHPDTASTSALAEKPKGDKHLLVRFFPTAEFAWTKPQDAAILTLNAIEKYIERNAGKKGSLLEGYKIALDPTEWEEKQVQLAAAHQAYLDSYPQAEQSDEEEEVEVEVEVTDDGEDEDLMDEDEVEGHEKTKKKKTILVTQKRKRPEPSGNKIKLSLGKKSEPPAKKQKLSTSSEQSKESKKEKLSDLAATPLGGSSKKGKSAQNGHATSANETEDEASARQVYGWRVKLQRGFLGQTPLPASETGSMAELYTTIENFQMRADWLGPSKLVKVLKTICKPDTIVTDDDKYQFRARSAALVQKWTRELQLSSAQPNCA
ncbi:uncharacterized protein L969DRAFT_454225 [Mixia osmundae IAM 14324]|uniref:uncharacterized protein n=1 Tax=Mixia osmundae (strain CBS 9802 / IAM 14324 / JCM 22182 / KY 12970) TaxID=764103 RepID=UPI0004A549C5|nr:uncharacterized protein L969DRAFT_454225 [Mixia osmundae IAM 14324]KEI39533.1 hypothetical protein L969DRAFT_454225 [Mixia osmundae IAM 14324]